MKWLFNRMTGYTRFYLLTMAGMLAFALCACSTINQVASPSLQTSLSQIGAFTVKDLQNADAIAQAQTPPDVIGHTCYVGLIAFVQAQQVTTGQPQLTVSGAFSAFETARATVNNGVTLISKAQLQTLELACGPLVLDLQNQAALFVANLAALGVKP